MGLYIDAWNIIMKRPLENEGLDRFTLLDTAIKYKEAIIDMARTDKELIKIRRKKKIGIRDMERELVDVVYNRVREREVNVNLEAFELIFEALRVEFGDEE